MIKKLNNRGDTMVEVLVAMAALSLIIGAAFALSNRNSHVNRRAQERNEAVKITETQLERLTAYVKSGRAMPPGNFCMISSTNYESLLSAPPSDPQSDPLNNTVYPANCVRDGIYNSYVSNSTSGGVTTTIFTTRWFQIGGSNKEEVKIYYRMP